MNCLSRRAMAWLVFLSLSTCYLALAPATTVGRGYTYEDMQSGLGVLASFNAWIKGRPIPPIAWTRHGPVPLFLDLPFIKLGKLFVSPDFVLSLQPILLTAAMLAILYLWLSLFCSPGISLLLTLVGAFSTMLWPYAYIGLETKQSFFICLAGYLALNGEKIRSRPRLLWFAIVCALAVTVKSTGVVLAPVVAFLIYAQFRGRLRSQWKQAATVCAIVAGTYALSVIGWSWYWGPRGGAGENLSYWLIDSPLQAFTNFIGLFGSPGKGLFVFAPALLLVVYAAPRAFRTHRDLVIFALLLTSCTVAFLCILVAPADELWGPRFLHVLVTPLLLVIGAAWPRFAWRAHLPLLAAAGAGLVISFLGAFFYYGERGWAGEAASQNTLEWYAGDSVWDEVVFDGRLFAVWLKGGDGAVPWTPSHHWSWVAPKDAAPWKTLNLRDYAQPQSFLLYYWNVNLTGSNQTIFRICLIALFMGPLLLVSCVFNAWLSAVQYSDTFKTRAQRRVASL